MVNICVRPLQAMCLFVIFFLILPACNQNNPEAELESTSTTPIEQPTRTPQPTRTLQAAGETPVPAATQTPVAAVTFSPTPESSATAELPLPASEREILILIQQAADGGSYSSVDYPGYLLPKMVLYTDGLLVWKDRWDESLQQTVLIETEMCSFLSDIKQTGIYEIPGDGGLGADDPIYSGVTWDNFSEGGLSSTILVNGSPTRRVDFIHSNKDYLVPEARKLFDLIDGYRPEGLSPYIAEKNLLYISQGRELADFYWLDLKPQNWPKGLPSLAEWIGNQSEAIIEITPEQAVILQPNFDTIPGIQLFTKNEKVYSVALRPLIPKETIDLEIPGRWDVVEFRLPFACNP